MAYLIHPENYNKPTPKWLKWIADLFLLLSGLVEIGLPDFPGKTWVVFGGVALKLVSKFIADHTTV
jgi:hypothetical protein